VIQYNYTVLLETGDFVDRIYHIEHEIKDTTVTATSASYFHLYLDIDNEGPYRTKLYDKWDDFNFLIVNIPVIWSNILAAPVYAVYILLWSNISELSWFP
jgi:hypothetical protein